MKKLFLFLLSMSLFFSCSSYKKHGIEIKGQTNLHMINNEENTIIEESFQVLPNTQIDYKKDQIGVGYYKLIPGNKTVFIYTLQEKPKDKNLRDGGYKEEILFEWEGKIKEMELKDDELSKVNMLVGMHGFFKKSGVFPVKKGFLKIELPEKNLMRVSIKIEDPVYMLRKKEIEKEIPLITK